MAARIKAPKPYPVSNLVAMNEQEWLDLNPRYQREAVWTRSQKQLLIDSLLNDFDIPKLYFRVISRGTYTREVVDGQQRLRTVFEFMEGKFKLAKDADAVDGHEIKGLAYKKLPMELQFKLQNATLDIVELTNYTDDDVEDMFLRLQAGTPLKAAEKRRAIKGTMRSVVEKLASHGVFGKEYAGFTNKHFAHEDSVAQTLHLILRGEITDIKPGSIEKTYEEHDAITEDHRDVKRLRQSYSFIVEAFSGKPSPKLRKNAMLSVAHLVAEMLETYDLSKHPSVFADAYLDFEKRRLANEQLDEEKQDAKLLSFTNAARSDLVGDLTLRHNMLREEIVRAIPTLALKDPNRSFTDDQRRVIYLRDGGICQQPGCGILVPDPGFHADHKIPHSRGGQTTVENGQVLCPEHNLAKGDHID